MDMWGFLLQVVGSMLVLVGLGWTWVWWSPRASAQRFRDRWLRFRRWLLQQWSKVRKPKTIHLHVDDSVHVLDSVEGVLTVTPRRPSPDTTDVLVWVEYLEGVLEGVMHDVERVQMNTDERLETHHKDTQKAIAESRAQVEQSERKHREALTRANLSGLGLAAWGGLLTFAGLLMAGPQVPT